MARAIGMDVHAWKRSPRTLEGFVGDLDAALGGADVVSLHLGLSEETVGLLNERRLRLPTPDYILINTARAELTDEQALLRALKDGHIGHAGFDVFHHEPLPYESAFRELENVTLTAHAAYMTQHAYIGLWNKTLAALESLWVARSRA
jgi:D-3-phosphoglycerate dehydrogenase / 2-oxoglutarate reductase